MAQVAADSSDSSSPVAVVTGSSSGIGRAIALELARKGCDVIVHGRSDSEALRGLIDEIHQIGRKSIGQFLDFDCGEQQFYEFAERAIGWKGKVDYWVNNAGADVLTGAWSQRSFAEKLDHLWKTDVRSSLFLTRFVGDFMRRTHPTSSSNVILNMGWDQAEQGMEGASGELFATTKGAIMSMTRSLAQSLAPEVRVNCIAPGWIQTKWGAGASEEWDRRAKQQSLMNRWGHPQDVANLAAFLCSDKATFISGQVIPVNGGFRYF